MLLERADRNETDRAAGDPLAERHARRVRRDGGLREARPRGRLAGGQKEHPRDSVFVRPDRQSPTVFGRAYPSTRCCTFRPWTSVHQLPWLHWSDHAPPADGVRAARALRGPQCRRGGVRRRGTPGSWAGGLARPAVRARKRAQRGPVGRTARSRRLDRAVPGRGRAGTSSGRSSRTCSRTCRERHATRSARPLPTMSSSSKAARRSSRRFASASRSRAPLRLPTEPVRLGLGPPPVRRGAVLEGRNAARFAGPWEAAGARLTEVVETWRAPVFLWPWRNPHPERALERIVLQPVGAARAPLRSDAQRRSRRARSRATPRATWS